MIRQTKNFNIKKIESKQCLKHGKQNQLFKRKKKISKLFEAQKLSRLFFTQAQIKFKTFFVFFFNRKIAELIKKKKVQIKQKSTN